MNVKNSIPLDTLRGGGTKIGIYCNSLQTYPINLAFFYFTMAVETQIFPHSFLIYEWELIVNVLYGMPIPIWCLWLFVCKSISFSFLSMCMGRLFPPV